MPRQQAKRCPRCGFYLNKVGAEDLKKEYPRSFEPWTHEEYLNLARLVQDEGMGILDLTKELGRAPTAVKAKMDLLGLKLNEGNDLATKRFDDVPEVDDTEKTTYVK